MIYSFLLYQFQWMNKKQKNPKHNTWDFFIIIVNYRFNYQDA